MTIDDGATAWTDPLGKASAAPELPIAEPPAFQTPVTERLAAGTPVAETQPAEGPAKAHSPWPLGYIAFGIAVLLVIAEGVAVYLASSGQPAAATIVGQVLVVLTALPLALGLVAALRGRNREWGIAAMVLAVVANPFILINVLGFFDAI